MFTFKSDCVDVACGCYQSSDSFHNGQVIKEAVWSDCFIDNDGNQIFVQHQEHSHVAACHIGDNSYNDYPDDLEKLGWVHFSLSYPTPARNYFGKRFNQKQKDRLFDIAMAGRGINENQVANI